MFGKRTSFGGNTPGATQPARPAVAPLVPAAPRQEVARARVNRRTGEDGGVLDVRSPEAVARDCLKNGLGMRINQSDDPAQGSIAGAGCRSAKLFERDLLLDHGGLNNAERI